MGSPSFTEAAGLEMSSSGDKEEMEGVSRGAVWASVQHGAVVEWCVLVVGRTFYLQSMFVSTSEYMIPRR